MDFTNQRYCALSKQILEKKTELKQLSSELKELEYDIERYMDTNKLTKYDVNGGTFKFKSLKFKMADIPIEQGNSMNKLQTNQPHSELNANEQYVLKNKKKKN
jgi:ribosomal protein S8E